METGVFRHVAITFTTEAYRRHPDTFHTVRQHSVHQTDSSISDITHDIVIAPSGSHTAGPVNNQHDISGFCDGPHAGFRRLEGQADVILALLTRYGYRRLFQ